jgi:hypothetical protein
VGTDQIILKKHVDNNRKDCIIIDSLDLYCLLNICGNDQGEICGVFQCNHNIFKTINILDFYRNGKLLFHTNRGGERNDKVLKYIEDNKL